MPNEQVEIALTRISGLDPRKAIQVHAQLGFNDNTKINKLTKYEIDRIRRCSRRCFGYAHLFVSVLSITHHYVSHSCVIDACFNFCILTDCFYYSHGHLCHFCCSFSLLVLYSGFKV